MCYYSYGEMYYKHQNCWFWFVSHHLLFCCVGQEGNNATYSKMLRFLLVKEKKYRDTQKRKTVHKLNMMCMFIYN